MNKSTRLCERSTDFFRGYRKELGYLRTTNVQSDKSTIRGERWDGGFCVYVPIVVVKIDVLYTYILLFTGLQDFDSRLQERTEEGEKEDIC